MPGKMQTPKIGTPFHQVMIKKADIHLAIVGSNVKTLYKNNEIIKFYQGKVVLTFR